MKKPKVNNERLRYLERSEADKLLNELGDINPDVRDMTLLSLHCGLRFGEIAALTWGKVDLFNGRLVLLDTKQGDRQPLMTTQVRAMLERRAGPPPFELVFRQKNGKQYSQAPQNFMRAVESLGFNDARDDTRERVTFHTARHTFASWHVLAGTDLYTLGKLMGHKTPSMTARYAHLSPEGAAKATRAFEAALLQEDERYNIASINRD